MDKIKDLGLEFGEAIVDNRDFSDIIKDLPILKTIATANDIRNIIFISKLKSFLRSLEGIPKGKILKEILKIDNSGRYRKKVGETLINLIYRSFEEENSEGVAILFKAFISGKISYDDFILSGKILADIHIDDIYEFVLWVPRIEQDKELGFDFLRFGLVSIYIEEVEGVHTIFNPAADWDESDSYDNTVEGGRVIIELTKNGRNIYDIFKGEFEKND